MTLLDNVKLAWRARKYQRKTDPGGIAYLIDKIGPGQTVMDIGAHKGGYLYFMRKAAGPQGHVIAFEPQLKLHDYLARMKFKCRWDNVTLERIALSDTSGTAELFIPGNTVSEGSSPGASIALPGDPASGRTETVATITLDDYVTKYDLAPALLKIDVEGNELALFRGGAQTLRRLRPKILVEIEARHVGRDQAEQTFRFLQDLGYTGRFIEGRDLRALDEFDFDVHQALDGKRWYCNNFVFE
jgi:FkbM family methyltransferase